jgi:U3 small nucleolar ribonucleoprotein protein IMP3
MAIIDNVQEVLDNPKFKVSVPRFCRRRLSYLMKVKKYAQSVKLADQYIVQGHVRIGPEIVTDPAFLVTRNLEDFITWTRESKIRTSIAEYKGERDDFDLLNN